MSDFQTITLVASRSTDKTPPALAARRYAASGIPVFPCVPAGKRPLTSHGFHDASSDLGRVEAWWRRHPTANIGIPTGAASGLTVLDIDVHGDANGFEAAQWGHEEGLIPAGALTVHTPSGGRHIYYPAAEDREQRSWQAASAGVDFRGEGGYIIVPPSRRVIADEQRTYRAEGINPSSASALDSNLLREFLDPTPATAANPVAPTVRHADSTRLADWVAARQEGERNRGLFWAACRMAEEGADPATTLETLGNAAQTAGLSPREVTTTVRSAYRTAQPATQGTAVTHARAVGFPSARPAQQRPAHRAGQGLS